MTSVLLTSQQPAAALDLATAWASAGDDVTVVLLDGATSVLRQGHCAAGRLLAAHTAGARIWAHDDAVAERAIAPADQTVDLVDVDAVADAIANAAGRVQWW